MATATKLLSSSKITCREDVGYVNELYYDTRTIYMPPIAKEELKHIK